MVWHWPGPEASMLCLTFSTTNIDLDYRSAGMLKHSYLKKADFKKAKDTQKQFSFLKVLPASLYLSLEYLYKHRTNAQTLHSSQGCMK